MRRVGARRGRNPTGDADRRSLADVDPAGVDPADVVLAVAVLPDETTHADCHLGPHHPTHPDGDGHLGPHHPTHHPTGADADTDSATANDPHPR